MNKKLIAFMISAIFLLAVFASAQDKTFSGEIMDNQCAYFGSHDVMKNKDMNTEKACTLGCVKQGGMFVLFDSANKTTYQLDDQKKPEQFAGEKVKVNGTYDQGTQTIHVTQIEAAQ